jgi:hypothetical protein
MRKSINEVQNMDVSKGSTTCLINDLTKVNVLITETKMKSCTYLQMKTIQKLQVRNIFLRLENVYDNG